MEQWSVEEERPYLRETSSSLPWFLLFIALGVTAAAVVYYFYDYDSARERDPRAAPAVAAPAAPAQDTGVAPAIRHPLDMPPADAQASLPTLDNSDTIARRSVVDLVGGKAFADFVVPDQLIRRIVATVDNLPRPTAPRRMMPLNPVPGAFVIEKMGGEAVVDDRNAARYAPYVRVLESLDTGALVSAYVRTYPLFQRAYEELGFPGKYFNDRLVEAMDDMMAVPDTSGPVRVVQGRILYEFADPDLETRSAGQKVMLRMGSENAVRVKAKLAEIRRQLLAARQK